MPKPHTLLCTIGTSLFYPNLFNLKDTNPDPTLAALAQAFERALKRFKKACEKDPALAQADSLKDWQEVAELLHKRKPTDRLCGAEINSVTDLLKQEFIEQVHLHLLHSDTHDGKAIAEVLQFYFKADGWQVTTHRVEGLRDDDPRAFRTHGLRNLAKIFGERVRETGADFCAINATGGYKAQIAIAVLMGQALDIPVYYKHERFDAIILFPPMPVALDFSLWQRASGMFMVLSKANACEPWEQFKEDWDARFEPLVNREEIDGEDYLELSATGQIFHETFRSRFQQTKVHSLPPIATKKENPKLGKHAYKQARPHILQFLKKLTNKVPYIRYCHSTYWNPNLPESTRFRQSGGKVQGIYSNGTWCVKFKVHTTTDNQDVVPVVVADLNDWLEEI